MSWARFSLNLASLSDSFALKDPNNFNGFQFILQTFINPSEINEFELFKKINFLLKNRQQNVFRAFLNEKGFFILLFCRILRKVEDGCLKGFIDKLFTRYLRVFTDLLRKHLSL